MSRIPRYQEHLKTGFTAEAVSAARCRAYAVRAEQDGLPNLAKHWLRMAEAKDRLAIQLLDAAGQARGTNADIATAIAEERYENDVLYPKMVRDVEQEAADVLMKVIAAQKEHLQQLEALRDYLNASHSDVQLPAEVDKGTAAPFAASSPS